MKFLTTLKLGPRRSRTPDGYLLCHGVPLARIGMQIYGPGETPVKIGPDGHVKINRTADELFSERTIDSFAGKPLIKMHPRAADGALEFVNPQNWKQLTVGIVMNPRRGTGADEDMMLGDILVTDADTIREVEAGHPQLSAGYDSDYFEIAPGVGEQRNILGNHVAIVPSARCGSRCAIGDEANHDHQERPMATKPTFLQRLREAFTKNDSKAFDEAMTEAETASTRTADCGDMHVGKDEFGGHVAAFNDHTERNDSEHADFHRRLAALEGKSKTGDAAALEAQTRATADAAAQATIEAELEAEAPAGAKGKAAKAADSTYLLDAYSQAIAGAEILMPGIRVPTFDQAAKPAETLKTIIGLRRKTLDAAYLVPETRALIDNALGGKPLDVGVLTGDEARTLFNSAVAMRKERNNGMMFQTADDKTKSKPVSGPIKSPADLNRYNAQRYAS